MPLMKIELVIHMCIPIVLMNAKKEVRIYKQGHVEHTHMHTRAYTCQHLYMYTCSLIT